MMSSMLQEMKATATAHVAGTMLEKIFYKTVVGFSIFLFISNGYSVLYSAATEKVTDIQPTVVESMPFPAVWVCLPKEDAADFKMTIPSQGDGKCATEQVVFYSKQMGLNGNTQDCANATDSADNDIIAGLLTFMNGTYGNAHCWLISDASHVAKRGGFQKLSFDIQATVTNTNSQQRTEGLLVGVLDGTKTWAEQKNSFGQGFLTLDAFSTTAEIKFSMDKFTEVPFRLLGMGGAAKSVMSYYSTSSSGKTTPNNGVGVLDCRIYVSAGSFVIREITTRYKTFSAICAEIGGVWASSLMLVTAFFVGKMVQGKESTDPNVPVQVFRLRGLTSQKAACKEIASMVQDVKSAAEENIAGVA